MHKWFNQVIDIHCHFLHSDIPERTYGDNLTYGRLINESLEFLQNEHQQIGVNKIAMSTFFSLYYPDKIESENEYLKKIRGENEGVLQWVVVDPRIEETFAQAQRLLLENGVLGIKIHSPMHKYDIHQYADKIFGWANECKTTVLMHPDDKIFCAKLADKYPDMNLIIAHLGDVEYIEAIKSSKHQNVYTDTSGIASYKNNIIEYAINNIGSERILFGTDTYSCAFQLGRIYFANISEDDKENILFKNAQRIFKGKL